MQNHNKSENNLKNNLLQASQLITKDLQTQKQQKLCQSSCDIDDRGVKRVQGCVRKAKWIIWVAVYKGKAQRGFTCEASLKSPTEVPVAED